MKKLIRKIRIKIENLLIKLNLYKPHGFYKLIFNGVPVLEDKDYPEGIVELRQETWTIIKPKRKYGKS